MHTFQTPGPTTLSVRTDAGHVSVRGTDTQSTTVELSALNAAGADALAEARVEQDRGAVLVELPRHRGGLFRAHPAVGIEITVPHGSTLEVRAESADVTAAGTFGEALITSGSGRVQVGEVTGSAKLKSGSGAVTAGAVGTAALITTGSGNVSLDRTGHSARITVGSGHIRIGEVSGDTVTKTGSGDVEVERLGGTLLTKSGSGNLVVRHATSGAVEASGASGSISIGVDHGTAAWLDVSTVTGRVRQELEESGAPPEGQQRVEVTAHTVSGDLRVHRS